MSNAIINVELDRIAERIIQDEASTVLIIVDHIVWGLYAEKLQWNNLFKTTESKRIHLWKAVDGEKTKCLDEYQKCCEFFLDKNISREAKLFAIGGGATSDFAGFVAATLLRGLGWTAIPTTLLSMVDAAIGGKVAINTQSGKNLLGCFHSPKEIWMASGFLETLPSRELMSGKGEILKYAFLSDEVFHLVQTKTNLASIIEACIKYKKEIVLKDPYDHGERVQLNLGHTFGHAFERIYSLPHGEAVVWGMMLIFFMEDDRTHLSILKELAMKLGLNLSISPWKGKTFPLDEIQTLVSKDKKMGDKALLTIVEIAEVGKYKTRQVSIETLVERIERRENELKHFVF